MKIIRSGHCDRFIFMPWKTIVIGGECNVSLSNNRMRITRGDEYYNIPINDIETVFFTHQKCIITIPIVSKLIENNVNIVICNEKNDPIGVFNSFNSHSLVFKQLKTQINWKKPRKNKLWKKIIEEKIQSEIDVLKLTKPKVRNIESLINYKNSVYSNDKTNQEAASARIYFVSLFGVNFHRDDISNIYNAALNYGYKLIASYISRCIVSRGMIPQLGIHHIGESNAFNLSYDFIEPFRAIIDYWVFLNVKDCFGTIQKRKIIKIFDYKFNLNDRWMRLDDAIEIIIDSYIGFLNDKNEDISSIDLSKGFLDED